MAVAITEDHQALGATVADLARKRELREQNHALLEAETESIPEWWSEIAGLGWLGIHLPEEHGGSGFGMEELVVIVEELGRRVAPGPFVPSVTASAVIAATADAATQAALLPGLADGSTIGAVAAVADVSATGATVSGSAVVLGGGLADLFVIRVGDDAAIVRTGDGVSVVVPPALDPARRSAKLTLDGAQATIITGGARLLVDLTRIILAADAVGVCAEATEMAAAYARDRIQFGRPIAMFQAVKHHCANMAVASELATGAVWDAAKAAATGGDQLSVAAAVAATLAAPAADLCANLNTQVHGGIAITWEHEAHLYMRRATTLMHFLDAERAAEDLTDLTRQGVVRDKAIELPPEAEAIRTEVRAFVDSVKDLSEKDRLSKMVDTGYAVPNWPTPFGRAAGAVEQLVIEEEFGAAGISKPAYGITGWNVLTVIQYGTPDQIERWVRPALDREVIWCQLFSEPDAGSDAAGVKTKATRVDGGWLVNGQKVWTSGAHLSGLGFATVRTNPDAKKHDGITMMVIDMHGEGVEVRPLKMTNGGKDFNEVFFSDVFVPDDDVVGPVDGGWTVARATLGFESVSIGGGGGMGLPGPALVSVFDANPDRLPGGAGRIGRHIADQQAIVLLNLRSANRAVAGGQPGPEGAMTKLVLSEVGHEATAILTALSGPESVFMEGAGARSNQLVLMHRGMSIAGGTSEIKRNQIGERILGLPRDPLLN